MKKAIAALCVLGASATPAFAQTNVTIYGLADIGIGYSSKAATATPGVSSSLMQVSSGVMQQSRLGFKGTEDLGGNLRALFVLESGFSVDTGASGNSQVGQTTGTLFGRASWIGLQGNLGTVEIGRRKDFIDQIATWYSSVLDFGTTINGVHDNNLDRVGGNRANNQIRYDTPEINGFTANVTYAMGENAASSSYGQSYGFGANYNNGPFGIGFGYWTAKTSNVANSGSDQSLSTLCTTAGGTFNAPGTTCLKTFMVGSSYKTGPFRFYGDFSRTLQPNAVTGGAAPNFTTTFTSAAGTGAFAAAGSNNDQTNVIDLGIDYNVTAPLKLSASILQSRASFVGDSTKGKVSQLNLGADYDLSKRTDVYLFLVGQKTSDMYSPGITVAPGGAQTQYVVFTGMRHTF